MTNATPHQPYVGTLEHLDPNTLALEDNVRTQADVTKQFVASVTENGVLVPITAVRGDDGTVRVRTGQRRTLAARAAGLATVPVYVLTPDGSDDPVERVVDQITENDHRAQLSATDRVFGIQALLDAGMSVTKTAKRLARPASYVKNAKAVASSQAAIDALGSGQLSLAEAAAIVEFEDDENALARLLRCAGSRQFDHVVGQLREDRESDAQRQVVAERYRAQGFTVLDRAPDYGDPGHVPLHRLTTTDGEEIGLQVVDDADPAQWAVHIVEDWIWTDKDTGEAVDEDDVDWETRGRPDAEPGDGLRHVDSVVEVTGFAPEYYCLDPKAAGLKAAERGDEPSEGGNRAEPVDEVAARRERRKVLALNKLGLAAQGVRREFVRKLLARKSPPKGAAVFVARTLAADGYLLANYKADEVTAELLGVTHIQDYDTDRLVTGIDKLVANLGEGGDSRAQVITLGLVLGALEARTPKDAWRGADAAHALERAAGRPLTGGAYLEFLAANGYELAGVEQIVTGATNADEVYENHAAQSDPGIASA